MMCAESRSGLGENWGLDRLFIPWYTITMLRLTWYGAPIWARIIGKQPDTIKELRLYLSYTQKELAQEIGVGERAVRRWEAGGAKPSPLAQKRLVEIVKEHELVKG